MVVVLDCRGAGSIGLTRHLGLLKKLAVTFNQHYPVRQGSGCCLCLVQRVVLRGNVGCWLLLPPPRATGCAARQPGLLVAWQYGSMDVLAASCARGVSR
jgi:hypothetical protein